MCLRSIKCQNTNQSVLFCLSILNLDLLQQNKKTLEGIYFFFSDEYEKEAVCAHLSAGRLSDHHLLPKKTVLRDRPD